MKRNYIVSAIIGTAALGAAFTVAAEQPLRTNYPAMEQLRQSAQMEHQNKMREWSMGLGIDLPGAPPLAGIPHGAPAATGSSARIEQPCHPMNHQSMKHLRLAKETEYQRRMREWSTGLGIKLPGAVTAPDMRLSSTSTAQGCVR